MTGLGGGILGFLIIAFFIVVIIAGIYLKIKEEILDPIAEGKKNKALYEFKYQDFISAVKQIAEKAIVKNGSEDIVEMEEEINNGIEKIGSFIYCVQDKYATKKNSVGVVKIHNYQISVSCNISKSIKISQDGIAFPELTQDYCLNDVRELKKSILLQQRYKDAMEVYKIK